MRVQYTIPGLAPKPDIPPPVVSGPETPSFRSRLRRLSAQMPVNWRMLLRLDRAPAAGTTIGPPPRPAHVETGDPARERVRWRTMLDAHARVLLASGTAGADDVRRAQRMVALLLEYRKLEDGVIARHLAEIA